ncbi:MAG TPA: adenosylmethionine--8-amino-7-oxononanoate transaminase [Urbifossiella sp.]|nr:adenosylmethionine--8-amino-7-oxononanoate transaminase [Urbifossiella sp.]
MTGFIVVGTDTDAGKTAFSLAFLAKHPHLAYWKPVETGESDTAKVRRLVPDAVVFEPLARFEEPVAPLLAARREGRPMPGVAEILAAIPQTDAPLLIETFGSPLSPLTDDVLQIELIRALGLPAILVATSTVGAIGRTLAAAQALEGVELAAIVLVGPADPFAVEQLARHIPGVPVHCVTMPTGEWTRETIAATALNDRVAATQRGARDNRARLRLAAKPVIWHPYTPLRGGDEPLPVVAADREFLTLADGRRIIDGISSWWTILHGHRPPAIMRAIRSATHILDHVLFAGATHPHAIELAEGLLAAMPWPLGGRIFYSDNGSTAVEVALKMAYQQWCHRGEPQRTLFISFEHGYHGDTFGAMSVGRDPLFFGAFEPLLFRVLQVPVKADALATALRTHGNETAAVIIEPLVQGAGGMRMHGPEELAAIAAVCREYDIPLIADEVMTGFGRTGSLWAFQQAGIAPDLVCLAKGITGGVLPLSATIASPRIVEAFDTDDRAKTFFHGHSFTANPIACAAAAANWKLMQSGEWQTDVKRIEAFWEAQVQPFEKLPRVNEVRICGLIAAVEFDHSGGYLAETAAAMRRTALSNGVLLRPLGNVLYAMPPLCTSDDSLEEIAAALHRAAIVE